MNKILVLQGIPAAGKTTFAKKFVKENDNWVRLNRDDIRKMFGEYWLPKREYLVEAAEFAIAKETILEGWNIIVDDTNLNQHYIDEWNRFAMVNNCEIEFKEFQCSLEEALKRDSERENSVGEKVIRKFYEKYYTNL